MPPQSTPGRPIEFASPDTSATGRTDARSPTRSSRASSNLSRVPFSPSRRMTAHELPVAVAFVAYTAPWPEGPS